MKILKSLTTNSGVIVYVMGAGRLPFASPHDDGMTAEERRRRLLAQIGRGLGHHQERAIQSLSVEYRNLVARLLTPVAQRRIGVRELCRHPWLVAEESADWLDDEEGLDDVDQDEVGALCLVGNSILLLRRRLGKG